MPDERLMCVWQATWARDESPETGIKKATLKTVTESLGNIDFLAYKDIKFEDTFAADVKISFDGFKSYVEKVLTSPGVSRQLVLEHIEDVCWSITEESKKFQSQNLSSADMKKLWQIFNRLCVKNSYTVKGAVVDPHEFNWVMDKIASSLGKTWESSNIVPKEGVGFQEFLELLDVTYFTSLQPAQREQCVQELHSWLIKEVLKVGWLNKRNKVQANWTDWVKRWLILTPTGLHYYQTEDCKNKTGEFLFDAKTEVKLLSDTTALLDKLKYKFSVRNRHSLEIELTAGSELEKQQWINAIKNIINNIRADRTPMGALLQEKFLIKKKVEAIEKEISAKQALVKRATIVVAPGESVAPPSPVTTTVEEDLNVVEVQKEKIKVVFLDIDNNGNAKIDKDEFHQFILGLGLTMERQDSEAIFDQMDKDENKFLNFEEFYNYFVKLVLGESSVTEAEAKLRSAFLAADRDGSGKVSFQEFAEYASNCRRDLALDKLLKTFQDLDKDKSGDLTAKEMSNYFSNKVMDSTKNSVSSAEELAIQDMLRDAYDEADTAELGAYLLERWDAYASYKRSGVSGELVMVGGEGMVDEFLPGKYSFVDLACFNDFPPIEPRYVVAKVTWKTSTVAGQSGSLVFKDGFSGKIPYVIGTNERLAYYGAGLANRCQSKISLLYRQGIQDFTYENDYVSDYVLQEKGAGGAGIEKHGFTHFDCPLDEDNGHFVLGKLVGDDEIHLTAFKIPARQTLYLPPFTIHSNDYLRGTWRTMLSDETSIDHVHLVKAEAGGGEESYQHFRFTFEDLI